MTDAVLTLSNLCMRYDQTVKALDNLSITVNRGDIYGLIGPNGAGKTTTFKIVAALLKPTSGTVVLSGLNLDRPQNLRAIRRKIGYMPDSFGIYEDMTVEEYLAFFAAAYGIENPRRRGLVEDVMNLVDMTGRRQTLIESLSRGMQQRLGLARVLIHDPELLILDEPASGLDPRARVEIRTLLLELQKMGKTILISSHILADLGEICNRVGIIEKGRMKVDGTLQDVLALVKPSAVVFLRVAADTYRAALVLRELPFVSAVEDQNGTLAISVADGFTEVWRLTEALVQAGLHVNYIEQESESLERAFVQLTQESVA